MWDRRVRDRENVRETFRGGPKPRGSRSVCGRGPAPPAACRRIAAFNGAPVSLANARRVLIEGARTGHCAWSRSRAPASCELHRLHRRRRLQGDLAGSTAPTRTATTSLPTASCMHLQRTGRINIPNIGAATLATPLPGVTLERAHSGSRRCSISRGPQCDRPHRWGWSSTRRPGSRSTAASFSASGYVRGCA